MNAELGKQLSEKILGAGFSIRELDWLTNLHALILASDISANYFDLLDAALKQPQLFCQKPKTLNDNSERSAALLGLTKAQFTAAALKQPQLFCQKPETINDKVERSAALLGLTKTQFTAVALKQPPLFYQKPETLHDRVGRSAALLGLTKTQFTAAALKQPQLFYQKPETHNDNVERSAALLGITKTQFTAAALKQPPLFCQKPETLNDNVERSAALLGLTKTQFTGAALKQPPLFYQKPKTLSDNVERGAALLGITKTQFTAAALKQPPLFCHKPETLNDKKPYILRIRQELGEAANFAEILQKIPVSICYSRNRLHARYVLAKLGLKRGAFSSLVLLSNAKASALIIDHFVKQIERTGTGSRALQVMHAQGLIATLSSGIAPIERPPHRHRPFGASPR